MINPTATIPSATGMINPSAAVTTSGVIRGKEDLKGKTEDELWSIFTVLINDNFVLKTQCGGLYSQLMCKDQEISVLRVQIKDIADLKEKIKSVEEENDQLRSRLDESAKKCEELDSEMKLMKDELSKVSAELNLFKMQLSAREIAQRADAKAVKLVFPEAPKQPFDIKSLKNLVFFIENPLKARAQGYCLKDGPLAWESLGEDKREEIKRKVAGLEIKFENLLFYIATLKEFNSTAHTIFNSSSEAENFYRDNGELDVADGLSICTQLLNLPKLTLDQTSEVDQN